MTPTQDTALDELEARLDDAGTLDDRDARIAEALEVPAEYFFAYRIVRDALRARADDAAPAAPFTRAQALVDSIGWHAATACLVADAAGDGQSEVAGHATRILGAVLELRQLLRDLPSSNGRHER